MSHTHILDLPKRAHYNIRISLGPLYFLNIQFYAHLRALGGL